MTVNINHEKKVFKKEQIQQVGFIWIVLSSSYLQKFDNKQYHFFSSENLMLYPPKPGNICKKFFSYPSSQVNPPKFEKCEDMSNLTYLNEVFFYLHDDSILILHQSMLVIELKFCSAK